MERRPLYENAIFIAPASQQGFFYDYRRQYPDVLFDFLTIEEVEGLFAYRYDDDAVIALLEKGYSYGFAKDILEGLCHFQDKEYQSKKLRDLVPLFVDLRKRGLLYKEGMPEPFFKGRNIVIRGYADGTRIMNALRELPNISVSYDNPKRNEENLLPVHAFADIHQELHYLCNSIAKDIANGTNPEDVYLVGFSSEFAFELSLYCSSYGIPFALPREGSFYDLPFAKGILARLKDETPADILASFGEEEPVEEEALALGLLAQYAVLDSTKLDLASIMEDVYRASRLPQEKQAGTIHLAHGHDVPDGCHAYLMDFTFGKAPRMHSDNRYFTDGERLELGMPTSLERNRREEVELSAFLKRPELKLITASTTHSGNSVYLSPWAGDGKHTSAEMGDNTIDVEYDRAFARYWLTALQDDYRRVRKESSYRQDLLRQVGEEEEYDPKYQPFVPVKEDKALHLSFSSVDSYYKCPFSYLYGKILHLDDGPSMFLARVGTIFHAVMEHVELGEVDVEKLYAEAMAKSEAADGPFSEKEKVLLANLLDKLKAAVAFYQEHFSVMTNPRFQHEKEIAGLRIDETFPNYLRGRIDLAIFTGDQGQYISILDYKTSDKTFDIKQTEFGLMLQLPIYAYVANHLPEYSDSKLIATGFARLFDKNGKFKERVVGDPDVAYETFEPADKEFTQRDRSKKRIVIPDLENTLSEVAERKLKEAASSIRKGAFDIGPLYLDGKSDACKYCKLADICYHRPDMNRYESTGKDEDDSEADE